mmetsp:Transcript_2769/g.6732  ORF Transcript_2769/g.6732 Transcript_2769/m.6732 type:complete len:200 (+) Transcript_2769:1301-1900(+)
MQGRQAPLRANRRAHARGLPLARRAGAAGLGHQLPALQVAVVQPERRQLLGAGALLPARQGHVFGAHSAQLSGQPRPVPDPLATHRPQGALRPRRRELDIVTRRAMLILRRRGGCGGRARRTRWGPGHAPRCGPPRRAGRPRRHGVCQSDGGAGGAAPRARGPPRRLVHADFPGAHQHGAGLRSCRRVERRVGDRRVQL